MKDPKKPDFRLSPVLDVFAARWKAEILWQLRERPRRFNELRRLVAGISQKTLAQELRELERDGLVRRRQFLEVPARVEYSSTALARSVYLVLDDVHEWWRMHFAEVERARVRYDRDATSRLN